jgi:thymidylate synthase (FAD)
MIHSDGSIPKDKTQHRISFNSKSKNLLKLFDTLCSMFGFDSHTNTDRTSYSYNENSKINLHSKISFHSKNNYQGKVFCATTSTGLLIVRGDPKNFGFVCGNSSPFEGAEIKFHLKLPIFVMRQLVRHRMSNLNEYSGRYSVMSDEFYIPEIDYIMPQSLDNKQGRDGEFELELKNTIRENMISAQEISYNNYNNLLETNVARELARVNLPVSNYTECYWKQDLHNFMHMLRLRTDKHAQREIRDYAQAMYDLAKPLFPITFEAFEDYRRQAKTLSRMDMLVLKDALAGKFVDDADYYGMSKREFKEIKESFNL